MVSSPASSSSSCSSCHVNTTTKFMLILNPKIKFKIMWKDLKLPRGKLVKKINFYIYIYKNKKRCLLISMCLVYKSVCVQFLKGFIMYMCIINLLSICCSDHHHQVQVFKQPLPMEDVMVIFEKWTCGIKIKFLHR